MEILLGPLCLYNRVVCGSLVVDTCHSWGGFQSGGMFKIGERHDFLDILGVFFCLFLRAIDCLS